MHRLATCFFLLAFIPALLAQEEERGLVVTDSALERLALGGELRPRAEVRDPAAPVTGMDSSRANTLRARVNLEARVDEYLTGLVELQQAVGGAGSASVDALHLAYLDLSQLWSRYELRLGRFEQEYGEGRMVAPDEWQLYTNTFDGARLQGEWENLDFSVFVTQAVQGQGATNPDTDFWGVYGVWDVSQEFLLDTYALRRKSPRPNLDEKIYGLRAYGEVLTGLDWNVEAALEDGDRPQRREARAQAYVATLHYALDGGHNLAAEWSMATGDDTPGDRDDETFRPVFMDAHRFNGIADVVAWSNLVDIAVRYWLAWNERWTIHAEGHNFTRQTARDAIYPGPGGAGLASAGGDKIGSELDLYLVGDLGRNLFLTLGGAYFAAGSAIRNNDDQVWGFVQLGLRF